MILSKYACGHTTRIPTFARRSRFVAARRQQRGIFKATLGDRTDDNAGYCRCYGAAAGRRRSRGKTDEFVDRGRQRCCLRTAPAFSSIAQCIPPRDMVLCHELSPLKSTDVAPTERRKRVASDGALGCQLALGGDGWELGQIDRAASDIRITTSSYLGVSVLRRNRPFLL